MAPGLQNLLHRQAAGMALEQRHALTEGLQHAELNAVATLEHRQQGVEQFVDGSAGRHVKQHDPRRRECVA